jgi:hypothetical protein
MKEKGSGMAWRMIAFKNALHGIYSVPENPADVIAWQQKAGTRSRTPKAAA